jgi:RNA polymerase subunit RPABC4/transcription elongation factor Spt4
MDESDITNNIATQTFEIFTIENVPDLKFGNINMTDQFGNVIEEGDEVINGTELSISVETLNVGGMKTGVITLLSLFSTDPRTSEREIDFTSEGLITNFTLPGIKNNSMIVNKTKWTVNTEGPIELHFFWDSLNVLKEYAEEDNNKTIHLTATAKPDFEVTLTASKEKITEGDKVTFTISVTDSSGGTFANYDQVYYKINTGTELISGQLDSSGRAEVEYKYTTPGTYEVFVDVNTGEPPIPESDMDDNRAYREIVVEEEDIPIYKQTWFIALMIILVVIIILVAVVLVWLFVFRKKEEGAAVCSECGSYLDLEATTCPSCGAEFSEEVECGECGGLMGITDVVCPHCDATFGEVDESALPPPGEGPPGAPVPGAPTAPAAAVPAPVAAAPPQTETPAAPAPAGDAAAAPAAGGEDVAECYMCGAIIPLSAPMCPQCGAEFE